MAQSSVLVSLPQMVDLALNSPEVGAVNFNILHSLLHVLIQQVDLLECKVEFVGSGSEKLQHLLANSKPGPSLNLTEYIVTPGKDQRKVITKRNRYKRVRSDDTKRTSKEEVIIERELKVIEQRKDSKQEPLASPSPLSPLLKESSNTSMQTVVMVEATEASGTAHVSVALSRVHFDSLEDEIEKLKNEIKELKELPANMGLIDALRNSSVDKSSPVVDMFQILTISKRIDATEQGIQKLASMIEDLAKEGQTPQVVTVLAPEERRKSRSPGSVSAITKNIPDDLLDRIDKMDSRLRNLESTLQGGGLEKLIQQLSSSAAAASVGGTANAAVAGTEPGAGLGTGPESASATAPGAGPAAQASAPGADGLSGAPGGDRVLNLESKLNDYTEQIATLDTMFNTQIVMLQSQFNDLEKEIGEIVERINAGFPAGDTGAADVNLADLYNKLNLMESEMEKMTTKLSEDKTDRQLTMDALVEQVELLKIIKANREDLQDALADKADACTVNRKVSHDQFDAACDDLSRGIEDALVKLTRQEQMWQQALDDIQKEIETKLDKMELSPLRDFVHNKLKMLQERLKALASLKKETEAAGTKSKYLRNVNCISCDKEVVMRKQMDASLMPPAPALPPTKSMAPYLAYELDALRKQQKCMPHSRNMNHFENAMTGAKGGKDDDHICNRYCGGSHTVTTPQQRVARLGHFLEQWGPETSAINEGQIRGTDGQMYKSREKNQSKPSRYASQESDDGDGYFPSAKARPSMMVQGGILSNRFGPKTESKILEVEELPPTPVEPTKQERKSSVQRASATQRVSADVAGKRKSSAGRASATRTSSIKKASVSPSITSASKAPAPEPPEGEEAPPAEAAPAEESPPEATEEAPAEEGAPAESPEAEAPAEAPAKDDPPDEEPPVE